jgi:Matrixin
MIRASILFVASVLAAFPSERPHQIPYCIDEGFSDTERAFIVEGVGLWDYGSDHPRFINDCFAPTTMHIQPADPVKERQLAKEIDTPTSVCLGAYEDGNIYFLMDRIVGNRALRNVAAHEVGHSLLIQHIEDRPAIMNSLISQDFRLYPADIEALCKKQGCIRER